MEKTGLSLRDKFIEAAQPLAPGFNVQRKADSKFMKFLNFFVRLWCPDFMDGYATAVGNTVYVPDGYWDNPNLVFNVSLLCHEMRHVVDKNNIGSQLYAVAYLFPQLLALGALGALGAIWGGSGWLWWLVCLVFLAPIPSPGRSLIEFRAYVLSMFARCWLYPKAEWSKAESTIPEMTKQFVGAAYYFMWPFKKQLTRWFEDASKREANDDLDDVEKFCKNFIQEHISNR